MLYHLDQCHRLSNGQVLNWMKNDYFIDGINGDEDEDEEEEEESINLWIVKEIDCISFFHRKTYRTIY